jgi:hypothetical protein
MKIKKQFKDIIIDEFNYVIKSMEESSNAEEVLYFFSGMHSVIQRILTLITIRN